MSNDEEKETNYKTISTAQIFLIKSERQYSVLQFLHFPTFFFCSLAKFFLYKFNLFDLNIEVLAWLQRKIFMKREKLDKTRPLKGVFVLE